MNLAAWESTLQFGIVYGLFALSVYASLSTGVLSLASITCGAIGGFLFAWLALHTGIPAFVALLMSGVAGGIVGYALSFMFTRLSGHFLAMATIALVLITNVLVLNGNGLTGGVVGRPVPHSFGGWWYVVGTLVVFGYVFERLRGSRIGLAAAVVRQDPLIAAGVGINPAAIQRIGFFLGGLVGGVAGVLFASLLQYIDPTTYYLNLAFISLASVVIGSAYRWPGAIVGGIVFTALPQVLSQTVPQSTVQVIYGVSIIAIMIFLPEGLYAPARWKRGVLRLARSRPRSNPDLAIGQTHPVVALADRAPLRVVEPPRANGAVMDDRPVVEVRGLTKAFGGLYAVEDFNVSVPRHSIFGILGPNGAGKTTVINLLSGVLPADQGEIVLLGDDVTRRPAHERAQRGLARTYQNLRLAPGLTTLQTIMAGGFIQGRAGLASIIAATPAERRERRHRAEEAREFMSAVGLTSPPDRLAQTLSYGDQRRVEIARALASRPQVLLLDEPTAGMNWREASAVGDLLRGIVANGMTVILIEHNMRLVAEYCDRCVVMHFGRVLAEGEPRQCLARSDVQEAYFGRRGDAERIEALRLLRADSSS